MLASCHAFECVSVHLSRQGHVSEDHWRAAQAASPGHEELQILLRAHTGVHRPVWRRTPGKKDPPYAYVFSLYSCEIFWHFPLLIVLFDRPTDEE